MSISILLTPSQFQDAVLVRDNCTCVICKQPGAKVVHLLDKALWSDGGFYRENGATVCLEHDLAFKRTTLSVEEVRKAAGISTVLLPEHLSVDHKYDCYGNQFIANGQRLRGDFFERPDVQMHLGEGGFLGDFSLAVSYPSTPHLPWSEGVQRDDKQMRRQDLANFIGKEVIASEKRDGENNTLYREMLHARSISGRHHPSRDWLKNFWNSFRYDIPQGYRICGEGLWARHSIPYSFGKDGVFFEGFSMWDDTNRCLSWDETMLYFELLGIKPVPVLYRGIFDEDVIKKLYDPKRDYDKSEGYVIRLAEGFHYSQFRQSVCKYVRKNHVQTDKHWMHSEIVPNI
ncbi:RNA ligase family protein [Pseudomonas viridiflava]|uniref:RNA ligase family protein n=1 Tax=Pseudomonas viridiflava TaxID=33069 RepID=UPI001F144FF9|nr:RNA ligase family protein [Pseudomonas viridiflava]